MVPKPQLQCRVPLYILRTTTNITIIHVGSEEMEEEEED